MVLLSPWDSSPSFYQKREENNYRQYKISNNFLGKRPEAIVILLISNFFEVAFRKWVLTGLHSLENSVSCYGVFVFYRLNVTFSSFVNNVGNLGTNFGSI